MIRIRVCVRAELRVRVRVRARVRAIVYSVHQTIEIGRASCRERVSRSV